MRKACSVAHLEEKAAEALSAWQQHFGGNLDCQLFPVDNPKKETLVSFEWRFSGRDYDEAHTCHVRCNNVVRRGVPFPALWETELQSFAFDECAARAPSQLKAFCFDCLVLGCPQKVERADIFTLLHLEAKRDFLKV